jgi:TonB family protein
MELELNDRTTSRMRSYARSALQPATWAARWASRVGGLVASLGLHLLFLSVLMRVTPMKLELPRPSEPVEVISVQEEIVPNAVQTAPEAAAPPEAPATPPAAARAPRAAAPTSPAPSAPLDPPAETPPAAEETPVDLTGVTLTSNDPSATATPTGNGRDMNQPVGPAGIATGRRKEGSPYGQVGGKGNAGGGAAEAIIGLGSLSRPPQPPNLDQALERNYPASARAAGLDGKAVVKAVVSSRGKITGLRVLSASRKDFGTACIQTLQGSVWTPPLDRAGKPVATEITYTCDFEVRF